MSRDMKEWKATEAQIEKFGNETALAPAVVLDCIVGEIMVVMDGLPEANAMYDRLRDDEVTDYICSRAALCYENNAQFRKGVLAKDPRPFFFSFVRHWMAGVVKEFYPQHYKRLPGSFANGMPIRLPA